PLLLAMKTVPTPTTTPLTSPLAHLPLLTLRVTPKAEANPATPLVEEPRMRSSRLRTSKALVPPPLLTARPSPLKVRSPQFMPKADSTVLSFRPLVPALKYQPRRMHRTASLSTWATVPPPPTQNSARFLP